MKWPVVALGELIKIHYGQALRAQDRDASGPYPVYGSSGCVGTHSSLLVSYPTLIIGRKGSAGAVTYAPNGGWAIDTAFYTEFIKPGRVNLRYLFHVLKHSNLAQHTITTAIPGLNRDDIYRTWIPLPPFEAQLRIASILDQADALGDKRRQATAKLDIVLRSVFLDTNSDSRGWPLWQISELTRKMPNSIRTGPFGSQLLHSEFSDVGQIAVLGIDNVSENRFTWKQPRRITSEKYQHLRRYSVFPGDVLVSIMGTCGRCALAPPDVGTTITSKHLCCITLDQNKCLPRYLQGSILYDPSVRQKLGGRGAVMPGLNMGVIQRLELRVPPLRIQHRYAAAATGLEALKLQYQVAIKKSENLMVRLMRDLLS